MATVADRPSGAHPAILVAVAVDNSGAVASQRNGDLSTIDLLERLSESQRGRAEYAYQVAETYEVILQAAGATREPRTFSVAGTNQA
jgi:hypothetical protein